uniref:ABC transporter permease n=1 Tax=Paraconexibacter sp. TaxID=2949640 RepID=UPI00356A19FF
LSFGPVGVQASGFFELFGTYDRMGSVYQLVVVRLFAPLVVGVILAGAAGTAICASLGARVVREETAALSVLGVDPIKNLVVPRVLALTLAALLFVVFAIIAGMLGALLVLYQHDAEVRPFLATFRSNATALELQAAILKSGLYGAIIAVVCCYRGMTVSGGPEGVGRAVNRAIVTCFLTIGFTDYVFTQLLLATQPILSQVRG